MNEEKILKLLRLDNQYIVTTTKLYSAINYLPIDSLRQINPDKTIAKEYILHFLMYFMKDLTNDGKYKSRERVFLTSKLGNKIYGKEKGEWIFSKIKKILLNGTPEQKGIIIQIHKGNSFSGKADQFILSNKYYHQGKLKYIKPKSKRIIKELDNIIKRNIEKLSNNIIATNQLNILEHVTIPTKKELLKYARKHYINSGKLYKGKEMIEFKKEHFNQQGILLINDYTKKFHSKDKNGEWKKKRKYVFLHQHMFIYNYYISKGLGVPTYNDTEYSIHRVYDSLNMLPQWMRQLFLIDGESVASVDIAESIPHINEHEFGAEEEDMVTYEIIQSALNLKNRNKAKNKYISFIFSTPNECFRYHKDLYDWLKKNNPHLLHNMNNFKYKSGNPKISIHLMNIEAQMMEQNIIDLNNIGVKVIYVFDELICKRSDAETVKAVMDNNLKKYNINTTTKIK